MNKTEWAAELRKAIDSRDKDETIRLIVLGIMLGFTTSKRIDEILRKHLKKENLQ